MEKTIKVYSIPIAPMTDYVRSGANRFGTPDDLSRNVQTMTVNKDRSFTFIIDKGDKLQSQMVSDAGEALARQLREVCVPEFDTYVFAKLAQVAQDNGAYASDAITKANAYESFLKGMEFLGDHNVPDVGRVAFCTYAFANYMMQDPAFVKYSDKSQDMVIKGQMGEIDGCQIVKVPASHLPTGCSFIITHKDAAVGPQQLEDYRIHDDPPGISGWLVEGRMIYDCFVINEKVNAIYYHGGQAKVKPLDVLTAATSAGKSTIIINHVLEGAKWYYDTAATASALETVTYGTAITTGNWTEMTDGSDPINHLEITPTSGDTVVRVVEVDASNKPLAVGDAVLNIG